MATATATAQLYTDEDPLYRNAPLVSPVPTPRRDLLPPTFNHHGRGRGGRGGRGFGRGGPQTNSAYYQSDSRDGGHRNDRPGDHPRDRISPYYAPRERSRSPHRSHTGDRYRHREEANMHSHSKPPTDQRFDHRGSAPRNDGDHSINRPIDSDDKYRNNKINETDRRPRKEGQSLSYSSMDEKKTLDTAEDNSGNTSRHDESYIISNESIDNLGLELSSPEQ